MTAVPPSPDEQPPGDQPFTDSTGYGLSGSYSGWQRPVPPQQTNSMAILALVLAFVFAPAGIVFGHIAKRQIAQTGEDGNGLATVALVIGYALTGIALIFCCGAGIAALVGWGFSR